MVAFGLLALVTALPWIVLAVALTGLAGAVFNPAVRTYLTHESPGRRAEVFAVFNVAAHAGALVGPLLGAALLLVDFRLVALCACVVFAALTLAQVLVLPARRVEPQERGMLASWWDVVRNRRFRAFTLFGSAYFALYNQIYLALPLEAQRVTGSELAVGAVFVVSTLVGIAGQVRLTAWCRDRWPPGTCVAVGLALMGIGFVPLAASAPFLPDGTGLAAAVPTLLGTVVFTVGMAITNPFTMQLLPVVGSERLVGTYYGFFALVAALITAAVTGLVGSLIDLAGTIGRAAPGIVLLAVGLAGAAGIAVMQRRALLDAPPEAAP